MSRTNDDWLVLEVLRLGHCLIVTFVLLHNMAFGITLVTELL